MTTPGSVLPRASTDRTDSAAVAEARGGWTLFSRKARRRAGRRQRLARHVRTAALTLSFSMLLLGRGLANTELDVPTTTTDLSTLNPTASSDLTFTNSGNYGSASAGGNFTTSANLTLGTFNDLDSNDGTLTLTSATAGTAYTITLSGGTNSVASANGGNAADLLFITSGASFSADATINMAVATGLTSGNFDVAGAFSLGGSLSGGSSTAVFTKTGAGNLTLGSGTNTLTASNLQVNAGTLTLSGTGSAGGVLQNVTTITVNTGGILALTGAGDVLGYTAGKESLVINSGGSVLNNRGGYRDTIENTIMMTGGTLGGSSTGDGNHGAYSFNVVAGGGLTASSDTSGNAATVSAVTSLQSNTIFNVTRGSAASSAGTPDLIVTGLIYAYGDAAAGKSLTLSGNGVVEFDALNQYTGTTNLNAGTLQLGGATSTTGGLGFSTLNLNGGTLTFGNALTTAAIGTLTGSVGNIALTNGGGTGVTLSLGGGTLANGSTNVSYSLTYANVFSGLGGITKTGTGTLTLSGANTYTGATTVSAGTLDLMTATTIQNSTLTPSGGTVAFDAAVTGNAFTVAGLAGTGALVLQNNAATPAAIALTLGGSTSSTYSGVLSGAGSLISNKTGTATQSIGSYSNTYSGGTTISGGTLLVASANNAGTVGGSGAYYGQNAALGTGTVTVNGGVLSFNPGSTTANQYYANNFALNGGTINAVDSVTHLGGTVAISNGLVTGTSAAGTINIGAIGGTVETNYVGKDLYLDGQLTGSGPLTISGVSYNGGMVHLTNGTNTYSGTVTVAGLTGNLQGGALSIDNGTALQNATLIINSTQGARGVTFGSGVTNATIGALGGTISTGGSALTLPTGTLTVGSLNTNSTYSGLIANSTVSGASSALAKTGTGTFTLTEPFGGLTNSFTGGFTVNGGTVNETYNSSTGTLATSSGGGAYGQNTIFGTGTVTVNSNATLSIAPGSTTNSELYANSFVLNGGILNSIDGNNRLGSTATGSTGAATLTGTGTFNIGANGGTLRGEYGGKDLYIDGQLTGSGALTVDNITNAYGASAVHFTNSTNTYSGTITVAAPNASQDTGGAVYLDNNTALQNASINLLTPGTRTVVSGYGSTSYGLSFGSGVTAPTVGSLAGSGNVYLNTQNTSGNPAVALTVGVNNASTVYTGMMLGSGSLTKTGTGAFTMSGASTYSGGTTVSAGTLLVTNTSGSATGTGAVMVNSGATLGGTGTITGATNVSGILTMGATAATGSVGTLTVGALTLASTTSALFDVDGATNFDKTIINGAVVYAGKLTVDLGSYSPAPGMTFQIFAPTGAASGAFSDDAAVAFDQAGYSGTFAPSTGVLTITGAAAVPEPSTAWMAGALCTVAGFGILRQRRRPVGGKPARQPLA